jgi:hypothetical protein
MLGEMITMANKSMICLTVLTFIFFSTSVANADLVEGPPCCSEKGCHIFEPRWVYPVDYNDPEDAWNNEPRSYDDDVETKAGCTIHELGYIWTPDLELYLYEPYECEKIRFYAWYDSIHCMSADIDVYYEDLGWQDIFSGWYPDREMYEIPVGGGLISRARISFLVNRVLWPFVVADLHELHFYIIP